MTSIRRPESLGKRSATAGIAFFVLFGTALALAAATACSGDDETTPPNYVGVNNATHPRLGSGATDGGAGEGANLR